MNITSQYDVGVDNNNFTPVSWKEVDQIINNQIKVKNMILNFDPERMIPVVFYHYPTCVIDRIAEFEDFADKNSHFAGDKDVKQFFEDCLKYAEEKLGRHLMDNKIAMKVVLPETGQYFYVGYKDNIYCIGLSLNPHMTGDRKFIV